MVFGIDAYATSSIAGLRPAYRPLKRSLTFPVHDGNKYSPIITGANGITRSATVLGFPSQTRYVVDFLNSEPEDVARVLKGNNIVASMH